MSVVYWEKQEGNRMCALHALNSLLQGPYITSNELNIIADFLDEQEKLLMGWVSTTNSSYDGNYNITVIQEFLRNKGYEFKYGTFKNINKRTIQSKFDGFLCNVSEHWLCFRNVHGEWYMLDSMRNGPIRFNAYDFQDYLEKLLYQGDSVFIITPTETSRPLPLPNPNISGLKKNQFYINTYDISTHEQETDFLYKKGDSAQNKSTYWPSEGGKRLDSGTNTTIGELKNNNETNDSIKIDGPTCSITIRTHNGGRITKRFSINATLWNIFEWIENCEITVNNIPLKSQPIYCLVQHSPYRKFVKYSDGSTELVSSDNKTTETKDKTLKDLELEGTQLFILHIPITN